MGKRILDIFIGVIATAFFLLPCIIIVIIIKFYNDGPVLYWSERIGKNNKLILMPKFRTMIVSAPECSSDRLKNPKDYITKFGTILRFTSLDELPQLYSVLKGDMSLVGPRPALPSQISLLKRRKALGIDAIKPGITGLAQINGRDKISDEEKCELDYKYLCSMGFLIDIKIILRTCIMVIFSNDISH